MMSPSEVQILLAQRIADTLSLDFPKGDYEFTYQAYKSFIDKYKQDYYDVMDGIKRRRLLGEYDDWDLYELGIWEF